MKILIGVHQFFPKHYTGTERYVLNLAKQLQKLGHGVKVLTYAFMDRGDGQSGHSQRIVRKDYSFEGVPVIALQHTVQPDDLSFVFDFEDPDIYDEVKYVFEQEEFDVYHCAHPLRIASSIRAARDAGVKVVFMVTDYMMMCPQGIMLRSDNTLCDGPDSGRNCLKYCFTQVTQERMQRRITETHALLESCDRLLSPSRFLIELFDFTGYIPADRFTLSRHGFDYEKKKVSVSKKLGEVITFGYIGTVQYHKGVHIMVEGFKGAQSRNIRLEVWGGCFHEVEFQKSVQKMANHDPRIQFRGSYNFNDIGIILQDIDIVIVPSIWYENAPLTITTSFAYEIPVIASDIGGMREAVDDGEKGMTFKVGNGHDLTEKIDLIAKRPDMISAWKKNIEYPIRVEEEAFNTEMVYRDLLSRDSS